LFLNTPNLFFPESEFPSFRLTGVYKMKYAFRG